MRRAIIHTMTASNVDKGKNDVVVRRGRTSGGGGTAIKVILGIIPHRARKEENIITLSKAEESRLLYDLCL